MNAVSAITLTKKYAYCKFCKSDRLGEGKGSLSIEDAVLIRTCECGWAIKVHESGKVLSESVGGSK